jgi:hypothetical protein
MNENIRTIKLLLAEFKNDITREKYEEYKLMVEILEVLEELKELNKK